MDYACQEIVTEILIRLPVKSLIRFMVVCRLWKSIITSPEFCLEFSKRPSKLLVHTDQECSALVERDEDEFCVLSETTDFPFKHWVHKASVVGSGNGLVCIGISTYDNPMFPTKGYVVIIWNPSIRKHAMIPMNPMGEPDVIKADGFGVTTDDYKYVRIVSFKNEYFDEVAVEIYSWKIGTWRRIDLDIDLYREKDFFPDCVSLRDRLHWMVFDEYSSNINSIHYFELENDVFEDIVLPECFLSNRSYMHRTNLFVIKESLALIVDEEEPRCVCSVWVMQEYGDINTWSKLCVVDLTTMIFNWRWKNEWIERVPNAMVHLLKSGELLLGLEMVDILGSSYPPNLVKYNPETRKATDISGGVSSPSRLRGFTNYYKESLVFLTDDHRVVADHTVLTRAGPSQRRGPKRKHP